MTLAELEQLRQKAQLQCKHRLTVQLASDGTWTLFHHAFEDQKDIHGLTSAAMVCELRKLATPPKPMFVTVVLPLEVAEHYANLGDGHGAQSRVVSGACETALSPYQPSYAINE